MQNRWKSKVALTAIGAQLVSLLIMLGVMDAGMGEAVNHLIVAVLEVLVAFGVLNNPTDSENF
ncbi:MAG: hypothetical protein Q4E13_04840 [Clostridia bacterium]|nr:hypothetical protein [Clostridia bacterium]